MKAREATPFENFQRLFRSVAAVLKSEVEKEEAKEQRKNRKKREKKKAAKSKPRHASVTSLPC
jgi:hypothetical protein